MNNYEKFLVKCAKATEAAQPECLWGYSPRKKPGSIQFRPVHVIEVEWCTGGASGGSCWGNEPEKFEGDDPLDQFDDLEKIVVGLCPNITHLAWCALVDAVQAHYYRSGCQEEYGNYSNYEGWKVDLHKLYDYMKEKGLYKDHDPEKVQ